jgi:hypothetical protein
MARAKQRDTKHEPEADDGAGTPEPIITAVVRVVFDPVTLRFGYFQPNDEEIDAADFRYATASEASSAVLDFAESRWDAEERKRLTLTVENGNFDDFGQPPPWVKLAGDAGYRRFLDARVYELEFDDLASHVKADVGLAADANNELAAKHDLPLGQSVDAAKKLHARMFPSRRRGSANEPALNPFLDDLFADCEQTTRDRNHKAFMLVIHPAWPDMARAYKGKKTGIAGILDAGKQWAGKSQTPAVKRQPPVRERLEKMTDRFRRLEDHFIAVRDAVERDDLIRARAAIANYVKVNMGDNDADDGDTGTQQ